MAGKKLGLEPSIDPAATVRDSTFGRYTEVGARTSVIESSFGDYSYIVNDGDVIYTAVGKFCNIAAHVRINPGNHPMWRATQHHFVYRASQYFDGEEDEAGFFDWRRSHPVQIGHDVWIGHGAVILPGRSIGTGAVVAAGAVVTKDVLPYTIVAGVPAKFIRRRFPQEIEAQLMKLAWWDWDHERLRRALPDIRALDIEDFIKKYSP
jgi:phosphonate metabolism protein (transferase hexapeptide repeat family)